MRRRAKVGVGLGAVAIAAAVFVGGPIAYVETVCRAEPVADAYEPVIADPAWTRPESRTFLTYPEWHMVYAYEDFARVLEEGDEHEFGYWRSVRSFWSSYCTLNRLADQHGGGDGATKQMVYTIGTSYNAELGLKALYEETVGRLAAATRGDEKTPQDLVAARMAGEYAAFLHQTPWYRFPFAEWGDRLRAAPTDGFRSRERRLALGLEWRAKQAYANLIARAVAATGNDELRIRSVIFGLPPEALDAVDGVTVVSTDSDRSIVESDRYAAFTEVLRRVSAAGGDVREIAGNDEIMVSVLAAAGTDPGAAIGRTIERFGDRGDGTERSLVLVKVPDLANVFRGSGDTYRVEHVFDY